MAGTIKLDGTTFLTKDDSNNFTLDVGSGGSISQGALGSDVVVPASIGGTMHFISKAIASNSASIEFSNLSNYSAFKNLYFIVNDIFPATENTNFQAQIATSGTTYLTSNYLGILNETYSNGSSHTTATGGSTSAALFHIGGVGTTQTDGNATESDIGVMGTLMLFSPNQTIGYHSAMGDFLTQYPSGYVSRVMSTGKYHGSKSPLTAIRFKFSSGNIASGSIAMYGIKDA